MTRLAIPAALLGAAAVAASSAAEAAQCGPRADMVAVLAKTYHEQPTAIGLSSTGRLLEIMVRADGRSWTLITTSPEGLSCVIDAGGEWIEKTLASLDPAA
jgi:hypothetical protein